MALWRGLYPQIAECLSTHVRPEEIEITLLESGGTIVSCPDPNRRGAKLRVRVTPDTFKEFVRQVDESAQGQSKFIILVGTLAGWAVASLAKKIEQDQQKGWLIVEPVPALLYAASFFYDLSSLILSGNVFWAVGPDTHSEIDRLLMEKKLFGVGDCTLLVPHGEDAGVVPGYHELARWIEQEQKDLLVRWIRECLVGIARRVPSENPFQKMASYVPRNEASWLLRVSVESVIRGMTQCGVKTLSIPADIQGYQPPIRPFVDLMTAEPDFLLNVNLPMDFHMRTPLWEKMRIPKILWYVDIPDYWRQIGDWTLRDPTSWDILICYDREHIDTVKSWGAQHALYVPWAADFLEPAPPREDLMCEVSFVGSVFDQRRQYDSFSPQLREFVDRTIEEVYSTYSEKHLRPPYFDGLVSAETLPKGTPCSLLDVSRYIYLEVNNRLRVDAIRQLLHFNLHLYGQPFWKELLGEKDSEKCYRGKIDYDASVRVMSSSQVNLSVTSIQTRSSLGARCFNIVAQRGCLVTEWADGLDHLLEPGEGVLYYHGVKELPDIVERCLADSQMRAEVVERGRDRVLREHTFRHRAETILGYLHCHRDIFLSECAENPSVSPASSLARD
ncbi:MAG TPA: glycosyltransferase [bacterium]|nr:glycosyltransferase [bacterium]HQL63405.1 glycosyltransferase [bacterium]